MATYMSSSLHGQGILGEKLVGGGQKRFRIDNVDSDGMCYLTLEATGSNFNFNDSTLGGQINLSGSFCCYTGGVIEKTLIGGEAPVNGFLPNKVLTLPSSAVTATSAGTTSPIATSTTGTGTGATVIVTSDGVNITSVIISGVGSGGVYAVGETIRVLKTDMDADGSIGVVGDSLIITITSDDIIEAKGTNWPGAYKWSVGANAQGEVRFTPQSDIDANTYYIRGTGAFNLEII